jgi:transposase
LRHLDERVAHYDAQIAALVRDSEPAQRLMTIPGIGPLVATALLAAIGSDPRLLGNGRGLAAFLGLVPRQHSTGGRDRLLGIRKRGDIYLRNLLIHGARSVARWLSGNRTPSAAGSRPCWRDVIPMSRWWHWPISSPASPGRC